MKIYVISSVLSEILVQYLMLSLPLQADTFADFELMTDRLVAEIMYHIEMYGLSPSRIRCASVFTIRN